MLTFHSNFNLPYYRYERAISENAGKEIIVHDSYQKIVDYLSKNEGNILLTIGSNNLEVFTESLKHDRIFARVLPTIKVIRKCISLGLTPKSIIGMQGPFSKEMNHVLMKDLHIKYMITKFSGRAGGVIEKTEAAKELGVEVHARKRPNIIYTNAYSKINTIIQRIEEDNFHEKTK